MVKFCNRILPQNIRRFIPCIVFNFNVTFFFCTSTNFSCSNREARDKFSWRSEKRARKRVGGRERTKQIESVLFLLVTYTKSLLSQRSMKHVPSKYINVKRFSCVAYTMHNIELSACFHINIQLGNASYGPKRERACITSWRTRAITQMTSFTWKHFYPNNLVFAYSVAFYPFFSLVRIWAAYTESTFAWKVQQAFACLAYVLIDLIFII